MAHGLDAEKTHVLYNGVDLEQFRPRPPTGYLHRELGLPADAQLIGNIGQIGLRKGQDVLLRAAGVDRRSLADRSLSHRRRAKLGEGRIAAIRDAHCAMRPAGRWPAAFISSDAATTFRRC